MATKKAVPTKPTEKRAPEAILTLKDAAAFDRWLAENHAAGQAVFVKLGKGGHPPHLSYKDALEVALTWGWIDSHKRPFDETASLQRFGPRVKRSPWSKINVDKAEALIAAGKMKPPGLAEVERAKADGRWERAYHSQKNATVPEDLAAALLAAPKAARFFATLDATNRYAILYRIGSVKKAETRERKIAAFVAMLAKHETLHPMRVPKKKG